MKNFSIPILGFLFLGFNIVHAQEEWKANRPNGYAPVNVMGDHYHGKGELMFSYKYMTMSMQGGLQGDKEISDAAIFQEYMAAPQVMNMEMHMLGFMYSVSKKAALMLMGNYTSNKMSLKTSMNQSFTTCSSGFGDISVSGVTKLFSKNRKSMLMMLGVSIPTGAIRQSGETPMMSNTRLAYPMQLGSGTFDPFLAITYLGQARFISWGIQPKFTARLGENEEGYSLGDRFDVVAWSALKASEVLSFSLSLDYFNADEIKGYDAVLHRRMMPLFNAENSGRRQMDLGVGSNFYLSSGNLKNLRFGVQVRHPVYQRTSGIQMKNGFGGTFGVQYSFGGHQHHH